MSTYAFKKRTPLQFHGGRWDGLIVEAFDAPDAVIVDEIWNSELMALMLVKSARDYSLPCYERRSSICPPIHYHAV